MGGALRIARILMLSIVLVGGAYGQTVVVDFDNPQPPGSSFSLLNQHAGIDWQNAWRWEGPYGPSDSNHIFFHNGNGTSRTFGFQSGPRVLEAIDVFAMANGSLTLSDDQGQLLTQALSPGAVITVPTGWVQPSTVVTVAFTGGWDLGVDNITHRPAGGPQYQLTVSMTGAGQGTVTSAPAGIDCGNSCNALFNDSTNVVLTPVASAGSEFIGWSGPADCADGNVTVSVELACVAQFSLLAPTEYPLTVTLAGGGSGTVTSNPTGIDCGQTCQEQYADGTPVTLAAVAAAGSQFDGWSGDADCSDASVIVDRAVNCVASFSTIVPAPAFDLSVSLAGAGTGSIASIPAGIACPGQCTAEFDEDAAVSLAASADPGSQFDGWSGAPACAVGNIVMVADTSCVATFSLLPPQNLLSITIAGGGGGTVESDIPGIDCGSICQAQYPLGTVVTLTATPDPASQFAGWSGDADCADGVVDLSVPVDCTADFALPGGGAGTALHFFGSGVSAPDRDRVKFLIDDYTTSSESGNALDIGDTDFTIEFWMLGVVAENTSAPVNCGANNNWIYGNIIFDRDRYQRPRAYGISVAGGTLVFGVDGQSQITICGSTNVLDDEWHHVAFQRRASDGEIWIYVDGQLDANSFGPPGDISYPDDGVPGNFCGPGGGQPCIESDPYIVLGAEKHDAGPQFPSFSGVIDELRISTALRYLAPFNRPQTPFTRDADTAGLYHFDEGAGEVVRDDIHPSDGSRDGVLRVGGVGGNIGPNWVPSGAPLD